MIEANGVVTRLEDGDAWVRVDRSSGGCGRCDEPGGCRSIGLAYALKTPDEEFRLPNRIGARVGDGVGIRIDERMPLRSAFATYGLGVALLIAGAAIGHSLAPAAGEDLFAFAGGAGGLAAVIGLNRLLLRSGRWRRSLDVELSKGPSPRSRCGGVFE
ncbi:SoxR reducing system RseC family protein [Aromatoleum sp.]|uniref:SoxR reducing system RseC family protein n=1 Tax=Aromatoleum sp. TaxID=2307007 RepID=UPI002FC8FAF4